MDETTWPDPNVRAILARDFVAVEADADRRLDLATRYQDFGWPALVVFDGTGRELWKHRGFVPPERLAAVLRHLVDDPTPLPMESTPATNDTSADTLAANVRATLLDRFEAVLDDELGGYVFAQKFLDHAGTEWLQVQAQAGDLHAQDRLFRWLDAERALLDPAFGGAYQYSHGSVWTNPHFEKVMLRQLADLAAYSRAFGVFGRAEDLAAAHHVARFLRTMLRSPTGAFWASQDADLEPGVHAADYFARDERGRIALGLPRIERSLWSRENGQAIRGLCALHAVAPDASLLDDATAAARWVVANRRRDDGLFAHGDDDVGGPFLADSLEMAAAFLALRDSTGDGVWLHLATTTLAAIEAHFETANGFSTARGDGLLPPLVDRAENLQLARVARLAAAVGRHEPSRRIAAKAFATVAEPTVALLPGLTPDLLLADHERRHEPVHVVVVGDLGDSSTQALLAVARRTASSFRHVEHVEPGAAAADGTTFPARDCAHAYVCGDGTCSPPFTNAERLGIHLSGN